MSEINDMELVGITSDIVSSYVAHNRLATDELPGFIASVYAALTGLGEPDPVEGPTYEPAVSVKKSLADPDFIVSLIDGRKMATLKRHLTVHGLTMEQYRQRYGLPESYPSVAPNYSARRSAMSLASGLGKRNKTKEAVPASAPVIDKKPRKARQSPVERLREAKAKGPFGQAQDKAEG